MPSCAGIVGPEEPLLASKSQNSYYSPLSYKSPIITTTQLFWPTRPSLGNHTSSLPTSSLEEAYPTNPTTNDMMSNRSVRITHLILFIGLAILGIVEGVHTIWLMVQFGSNPDDPSSIFKGRLHALVVASIWTAVLCPIFIVLFLKAVAVASLINTTIFLGLTWVLWLVGAIVITQYLRGGFDCTKTEYCHQLYHGLGFAWGTWLLTTITCVVVFIWGDRAFRRGDGTPAAKA